MKRVILGGFVLTIGLALLVYGSFNTDQGIKPSEAVKAMGTDNSKKFFLSQNNQKFPCEPGLSYHYALSYTSLGSLKTDTHEQLAELVLDGQLERSCFVHDANLVQLIKIREPAVIKSTIEPVAVKTLIQQMEQGAFVRADSSKSHAFSSVQYQGSAVAILNDIIDSFNICQKQGSSSWTCKEEHTDRSYIANYKRRANDLKKTYEYSSSFGVDYQATVALTWPDIRSISYKKSQEQHYNNLDYRGTIAIKQTLEHTEAIATDRQSQLLKAYQAAQFPLILSQGNNPNKSGYVAALGNSTFTELWQEGVFERSVHFLKILGWLSKNKDFSSIKEEIVSRGELDKVGKMWVQGLGKLGQEQHQKMLVEIFQALSEKSDKRYTMTALGFVNEPSNSSVEFLKSIVDDNGLDGLGRNALLNLGIMSNKLTDDHLFNYLISQLEQAQDPAARALVIRAIGNSQHEQVALVVDDYYSDSDDNLRTAAIFASRYSPEALPHLLKFLYSDTYGDALAAARALKHFKFSGELCQAVLSQWSLINFQQARDQLANTMQSQFRKSHPSAKIRAYLEQASQLEKDPGIQKKLAQLAALANYP